MGKEKGESNYVTLEDGSKYMLVKTKVKLFRDDYPTGTIQCELLESSDSHAIVKAFVTDHDGNSLATGLSRQNKGDSEMNSTSFMEIAETVAVGRALSFAGYGLLGEISSLDEVVQAKKEAPKKRSKGDALKDIALKQAAK